MDMGLCRAGFLTTEPFIVCCVAQIALQPARRETSAPTRRSIEPRDDIRVDERRRSDASSKSRMPRFKLILEYDGAPFVGWQRQDNGVSVQEALEGAVFAMTGDRTTAHAAGRTDAGVHAMGQVAHVDLTRDWAPFR